MVMLKNCNIRTHQSKLQQLQWKGRTRGRPRTRWRDEIEEDWDIVGIKNKQGMVGDRWECRSSSSSSSSSNNNNNNNNNSDSMFRLLVAKN